MIIFDELINIEDALYAYSASESTVYYVVPYETPEDLQDGKTAEDDIAFWEELGTIGEYTAADGKEYYLVYNSRTVDRATWTDADSKAAFLNEYAAHMRHYTIQLIKEYIDLETGI